MSMLQYKAQHYGKQIAPWSFQTEPHLLVHASNYVTVPVEEAPDNPWEASAHYLARRPGNHVKKFVLLEIKRVVVKAPYKRFDKTYLYVLTHNPFSKESIPRPMRFWVDAKWTEPLKKESYESVLKKQALDRLKKKWNKKTNEV